jgi:signal transduction histidine kinase
MRKLHNN